MNLEILGEAERELFASAAYYDSKEAGLGARFRQEIAAAVRCIERNPDVARLRKGLYRRVNLRSFPHYIAYISRGETIWIVAIAHAFRRPEFWLERAKGVD